MDTTKVPIGQSYGPVATYCDAGEIAAFGLAVNDDCPLYRDGRAAPPTYALVSGLPAFLALVRLPDEATAGGRGAGHGEHDLYLHRPVEPGTVLQTSAEISSVVVSKVGMNVFARITSVDDQGRLVFEQFWSAMHVGPVTGGDQGRPLADHTFPEEARANKVGEMVLGTTADQTFRYGGASGDRAPTHIDDRAGNLRTGTERGKILQGACTLGVASRALVALAAGGDPRRVKRIAVRFSRYVYPGDEIVVSVFDAGPLADGNHAFAFEAVSDGQVVLRHGRVEVAPIS